MQIEGAGEKGMGLGSGGTEGGQRAWRAVREGERG